MLTVVFMTGLAAGACSPAPSTEKAAPPAPERTACQDPRPQICTAHYDPVCGFTGEDTYKTYANACAACSDKRVSGHRPGACE
jgi:hypothetical protein